MSVQYHRFHDPDCPYISLVNFYDSQFSMHLSTVFDMLLFRHIFLSVTSCDPHTMYKIAIINGSNLLTQKYSTKFMIAQLRIADGSPPVSVFLMLMLLVSSTDCCTDTCIRFSDDYYVHFV